ncbi:START-like domain-containing protein [Tenuifilum thalassicum]|uniref:SRPBCC domain-containing protein n=1 Tax=Tenuifilum thalassicum TaxID=2590900 RepID=A0A7D3XWB6_9BACT|nr:START-like domain-containing protein [Tenuifilum thalassicum]QKG80568.1 SRPBCC domain-containing protein [Tenuifilum thalassicum]
MKGTTKTGNKVELEFPINTSPGILFKRLCTPHGLSEWFADDVNLSGNIFTFFWDGDTRKAELVDKKENKCVKFKWLNDDEHESEGMLIFKLQTDELTGETSLTVIEEIPDDEDVDETISLWNHQIGELKRLIGA